LVVVVASLEESIDIEQHTGKCASQGPDVKRVMILSILDEELGTLVVSTSNAHIVLSIGLVVVCETPIDYAQVALFVVNNDVKGLDVTMHDTVRMSVIQSFKNLVGIQPDVQVIENAIKLLSFDVRNILKHKYGCF